jgi:hypothetical protein
MNPTLRYGSRGNYVQMLQQGLNQLPSALPALATDGIFGTKTVARVREFQSKQNLAIDGIVGPNTWGVLLDLLGKLIGLGQPPTSPPKAPPDPLRAAVLNEAQRLVGKVHFGMMVNGRPKGIDLIKTFFAEAANVNLQDANFKTSSGAWTQEPIVGGKAKSWCGIFCVYCYRKAGIKSVRWDLKSGRPVGPIRLASWSPTWVDQIKSADIGTVATKSHHFLLKQVESGSKLPRLHSIDGNQTWGQILEYPVGYAKCHRVGTDNFNYYVLS